jgi:hypothetical protein
MNGVSRTEAPDIGLIDWDYRVLREWQNPPRIIHDHMSIVLDPP